MTLSLQPGNFHSKSTGLMFECHSYLHSSFVLCLSEREDGQVLRHQCLKPTHSILQEVSTRLSELATKHRMPNSMRLYRNDPAGWLACSLGKHKDGRRSFANCERLRTSVETATIRDRLNLRRLHAEMYLRRKENKEGIAYLVEEAFVIQQSMTCHWLFQDLAQAFHEKCTEGTDMACL